MELEDMDDNGGFVNMNAKQLQKGNHEYKKYLDHFLKHRFLRTDMKYIVGRKSRGYMINKYNGYHATVNRIPIKDFVLSKNKRRELDEQQDVHHRTIKNYSHLTQWFDGL